MKKIALGMLLIAALSVTSGCCVDAGCGPIGCGPIGYGAIGGGPPCPAPLYSYSFPAMGGNPGCAGGVASFDPMGWLFGL